MSKGKELNPDIIIQNVINSRLELYRAQEQQQAANSHYNLMVDELIQTCSLMKIRILALEKADTGKKGTACN